MQKGITPKNLRKKIAELEAEAEEMVKRNADPREIALNRKKVSALRAMLNQAEETER